MFIGFDDRDLIEGTFNIQAETKVINAVSIGSSVITVDSTIGFPDSGTIISGDNTITYTSKSVNQFLGCSGIQNAIAIKDNIRTSEYFFGYENGDVSKEVRIRITGVLSKFTPKGTVRSLVEGQKIYANNVGEKILNQGRTGKEILANSWIYNTSSRFDLESYNEEDGTTFVLKGLVDKSSLRVGDSVDILNGTTNTVLYSGAIVSSIDGKNLTLDNLTGFVATKELTLRRNLRTSSSTGVPISFGNNSIISDVMI